jgi:hypothetical protein
VTRPEGEEKVIIPWHDASIFVPPNRWFHQHFNAGEAPARNLAWHPLPQIMDSGERIDNRARDQIEYPFDEPWIRQRYEEELAKHGLASIMPEEAYQDPNFEWEYAGESKPPVGKPGWTPYGRDSVAAGFQMLGMTD